MFIMFGGAPLDPEDLPEGIEVVDLTAFPPPTPEEVRHVDRYFAGLEMCPHYECGSCFPFSCN